MGDARPAPTSSQNHDSTTFLSTHVIPHSASEPPKPSSSLSTEGARAIAEPKGDAPSPPPISPAEASAFSSLKPTGSSEVATYTAASTARNFEEFDPNRRTSLPSPATVIDAASKTFSTTVTAPGRTVDAIKEKLKSPSTGSKSKSDIPDSIGQLERDLRHNRDAPGNLDGEGAGARVRKSDSFSSLFGKKSGRNGGLGSPLSSRASALPDRPSVIPENAIRDNDGRQEEEEEDEEIVQQRIREGEKRLEELDEAQTLGLLRTQQEAGIEPVQSPEEPAKPGWLVGLPLFGAASGHKEEGSASRRGSFRRSGRGEGEVTASDDERTSRQNGEGVRRSKSEKSSSNAASRGRSTGRSASASRAGTRSKSRPRIAPNTSGPLQPPRRNSTTWTSKLRTKIPIKEFPLQGAGRESEFNQECPLWARQPYKYLYFSYFGLSVGLYHLPRWAVSSVLPSHRGRPGWSWKKATMVKLFRHGTKLTFRTRTSLGRDLQKEVPHSKTVRCKFTWVQPVGDGDVRGELKRAMLVQKVQPQRTCGFWYGDVAELAKHKGQHGRLRGLSNRSRDEMSAGSTREVSPVNEDGDARQDSEATLAGAASQTSDHSSQTEAKGGVGRPAQPGEKVLYHLHGGAYWIGTAHEKDVTAAVNTESLRYMAEIYKAREKSCPTSEYSGKLLRSFSLDYRLCVPGRPRAGSYPAALLDALSGYLYLVRELGFAPENIIVAGDSAGGNLGLSLCRYLRDEGESIAPQPGALLLMSPWVDVSRSHSGPTGAPNLDSTVYLNRDSDIISSLIDFRNTAVSAFLGDLPARETYRNPYISPVSLQLPLERGGSAPYYGFHGFPKKIYITTGSAEISYDQHLTLAHRLASGTKRGRPVYAGDRLSAGCNAREMAERRNRPRPKEMLDAEQNDISVTPLNELQGMGFSRREQPDEAEEYATQVVDGEPSSRPEHRSRDTKLAGESKRLHASPPPEPEGREDREVVLDEVKDAVHDYLLFKWFEPERSSTWRRIAQWIDEV